jgi:toxin ParE1/3/4
MAYLTTRAADEDIIGIYQYGCATFGQSQAEHYFAGLRTCFEALSANPHLGRTHEELQPSVRLHFHRSHVIAYVAQEKDILIVRVLGARQDWKTMFQP